MFELSKQKREYLERLKRENCWKISNGYYYFLDKKVNKSLKKNKYNYQKYKRSKALIELHLNKELESCEIVHHKDEDTFNDKIENLEVMNYKEHLSLHHAGKRNKFPNRTRKTKWI